MKRQVGKLVNLRIKEMKSPLEPSDDLKLKFASFEAGSPPESWKTQFETNLENRLDELRRALRQIDPRMLAWRAGADWNPQGLHLRYWGTPVQITIPEFEAYHLQQGKLFNPFDTGLILYYLATADGAPMADRWISFRELPGGMFYHQAFQAYSGDQLAKTFDPAPDLFPQAAERLGGIQLSGLANYAYAFHPLPRIRLAAVFYPGDEEFSGRGIILFDAASSHYMVLDGLAILGAHLVKRLQKACDDIAPS